MRPVRKFWTMDAANTVFKADTTGGTLTGIASVMGNLDSADDVIFPGAYKDCLEQFRREGLVLLSHEWDEMPVAMPTLIEERGNALYAECEFHSTQEAQDARTVCSERLGKGLSVGLSVGFLCSYEDCQVFESGEKLLQFAANNGYDLALFDRAGIMAHKEWCRAIIRVQRLIEYSIVPVPANGKAQAIAAKSAQPDLTARDYEQLLCDAGLSRAASKRLISGVKSLVRDADPVDPTPSQSSPPQEQTSEAQAALLQRAEILAQSLKARKLCSRIRQHGATP